MGHMKLAFFQKPKLALRLGEATLGAVLRGLGCGLLIVAGLGGDPITLFNAGLQFQLGWALPDVFLLVNVVVVALILMVDYRKIHVGTLITTFMIGQGVVISSWFPVLDVVGSIGYFALAIVVSAIGIALYAHANVGLSPQEGIMMILHEKLKKPLRYCKMGQDAVLFVLGWILGGPVGIGTVVSMLVMGPLVERLYRRLKPYAS